MNRFQRIYSMAKTWGFKVWASTENGRFIVRHNGIEISNRPVSSQIFETLAELQRYFNSIKNGEHLPCQFFYQN